MKNGTGKYTVRVDFLNDLFIRSGLTFSELRKKLMFMQAKNIRFAIGIEGNHTCTNFDTAYNIIWACGYDPESILHIRK